MINLESVSGDSCTRRAAVAPYAYCLPAPSFSPRRYVALRDTVVVSSRQTTEDTDSKTDHCVACSRCRDNVFDLKPQTIGHTTPGYMLFKNT